VRRGYESAGMGTRQPAVAFLLSVAVLAATFAAPSHTLDVTATRWLQRAAPIPDIPASLLVFLGNAEVLIPAVAAAGLVLWSRDRARATMLWGLAAGLVATSLIAVILKRFIPHPGPPAEFKRPSVFQTGVGVVVSGFGFPSGHTMRMTYVALCALRRTPPVAATAVLAMMTALVYLGRHWTTEVLGGLCLGWAYVEAAQRLTRARLWARLKG
jgi:membrane-associated phospholipid phosphatase